MAADPMRTAVGGFAVEGSQFVEWILAEHGVNKSITTQLYERMAWQRYVVAEKRRFQMTYPFFGVLGALHVEDIWSIFAHQDPLGLRGRLCLFYTRPTMKKAREVHAANDSLGNYACADTLEAKLVDRYYSIWQAHALEHAGRSCLTFHLIYPFRTYTLAGAPPQGRAFNLFAGNFDYHVQMQDGNYLSTHEATKVHGKLKGNHIRHSLNILNIENACASRSPLFWQTTVDEKHMRAAELVGAHCEQISVKLIAFATRIQT